MNQPLDLENTCNYCFERSLNDKKIFSFKTKLVIMHLEKDLIESEKMIVWTTFFDSNKWFIEMK